MAGSLRRDIVGLLVAHYARPHTEILTVPMGRIGHHRSPGGRVSYTLDQLVDFQLSTRIAPGNSSAAAA